MSNPGLSLDTLFGGSQQSEGQKPLTLDQLFAPQGPEGQVKSGPAEDTFFSMGTVGHVLDAFGHGAKQGWGDTTVSMTKDEQDFVKKAGISENYNDIRSSFAKAVNEAFIRPAASSLASIVHGGEVVGGAFSSVLGGTSEALQETGAQAEQKTEFGKAIGAEQLGHTLGEVLQYETSRGDINLRPITAHDIAKARSLGTIGEGEAGYFDTKTVAPENVQARSSATRDIVDAQKEEGVPEQEPLAASPAEAPPPDIHEVARQISPDTFQEYDALAARREQYRTQLADMAARKAETPEGAAAQAKIDDILGKVNGVEDRLTNAAADRLEAARDVLRSDTEEMATLRKQLLATDYRMRDLAPDVASAYRQARDQIPEPEEAVNAEAPQEQRPAAQEAPAETQTPQLEGATQEVRPGPSNTIAQDVSSKLVTAGRPLEEANAAAAIVQAHYEARAERFGGFKGTPQEMYARDAPNIKGAGQKRALEMAQGKTLHQSEAAKPTFYSALSRGVENIKQAKASAKDWSGLIDNLPGVKKEEVEWSGVKEWLASQKGSVSKEQVLEHLRENEVKVQEVEKSDDASQIRLEKAENALVEHLIANEHFGESGARDYALDAARGNLSEGQLRHQTPESRDLAHELQEAYEVRQAGGGRRSTKFSTYTLPGGENYRELLLTMPSDGLYGKSAADAYNKLSTELHAKYGDGIMQKATPEERQRLLDLDRRSTGKNPQFKSGHFDEPNVLAHIRFDDRTGPNGEKILHIAEIQSDWHQKGRRGGYELSPERRAVLDKRRQELETEGGKLRNEGKEIPAEIKQEWTEVMNELQPHNSGKVPNGPFKTSWQELAMKRMLRYAAEHGYDKLSWDTGETQAARYDLSKQISRIDYERTGDGKYEIEAYDHGDKRVIHEDEIPIERVEEIVGKEIAKKIVDDVGTKTGEGGYREWKSLAGLDLKVGGEGMKGFYDKILPAFLNKYAKKWGAKVQDEKLNDGMSAGQFSPQTTPEGKWRVVDVEANQGQGTFVSDPFDTFEEAKADSDRRNAFGTTAHSIDITDDMRKSVEQGQSLFQGKRGSITLGDARNTIKLFKNADASTFLHETGHHWLEELMADASEAQAPNELKADAATVRDWLGVKDGENIPTKAHEKFARGFERYLMEGVAPSKALASVFAKFKEWLTQIYQTVNRLRSPINEDIRAVFDRLLSANPERTVIAPERNVETSMADIHEAEAEHTPPERAGPVADQIRSEIDAIAKEKVPDVHAELTSPDVGAIEGENADIASGADEGVEPATEENPSGFGAESKGGNETQGEGAKPRGESGTKSSAERLAGPNDTFASPDSEYIDKAGNIVLDNLNTNEDVKTVLRQVADMNDAFLSARRGVVSDADVMSYADAMGVKAREVNLKKLRAISLEDGVPLAARIRVGREMLIQSAQAVHDAMNGYDEMAYAIAAQRHLMIQETLSAITAEVGRGLRAFRTMGEDASKAQNLSEFLKQNTGRTLNQLKEEMAQGKRLDTPAKVSGYLKDVRKPSLGDMGLEIFKNWLISGPITHTTYAIGNTMLALWKAVPETAAEAAIGAIRGTESTEKVLFGEVGAQLYAIFRGQRNGFQAAWDSMKAGQTIALPGEETGLTGKATTLFTQTQAVPGLAGKIIRAPGERMVAPIHSYFRSIGYAQAIARQAYRQASIEELRGHAFNQRIAELTKEPTKEMMEAARAEATEQTLMGPGGELTKRVSALMNWEPKLPFLGETKPFAFIDPFVHIASTIVEQAVVERSGLGLLSEQIRKDLRGENGEAAKNATIARMAAGTALSIVAGGLAMEGLITPSEPSDPKEAAMWRRVHGMPHSLKLGDTSVDLSRLGVLGFQVGIAADLYHASSMIGKEDKYKIASLLVHSFTQNFLDEGFMRGPSDLIKALDDNERYGASYFRNFVSTIAVPFSVGMSQVARQIDPYSRQARTTLDAIKAKVPWWSETLMPRRDIWGEPIANREWLGTYTQDISSDPVDKALMDAGVYPAQAGRKIRGVELTDQQYDDYVRVSGRMAKMQLTSMVNMPGFDTLPVGVKQTMIKDVINSSRENGRSLVMMQYPDIIQQATDLKTAPLMAQEPTE